MYAFALIAAIVCAEEHNRWEMQTPWAGTDREIVVADVTLFRVKSHEEATRIWKNADRQAEELNEQVKTWNTQRKYQEWIAECQQRSMAWYYLSKALHPPGRFNEMIVCEDPWLFGGKYSIEITITNWDRVQALYELRKIIGDDAFYSGQMPNPMPTYKIGANQ